MGGDEMNTYIEKPDSSILAIVGAAFPEYKGKKFELCTDIPSSLHSYWEGGSRDRFVFVQLSTMKAIQLQENHPIFQHERPRDIQALPPGIVIVMHSIFRGKDMGITIYSNAGDLNPMLPAPTTELSDDEKRVLYFTRSRKSSYGGIPNFRQRESGLSPAAWEAAKQSCIAKGLLLKSGAITAYGRNVCPERIDGCY
jgi:hypothetical protein